MPFAGHLWTTSKTWDPEGPLSTLSAAAIAVTLGAIWSGAFPINKSLSFLGSGMMARTIGSLIMLDVDDRRILKL